MAKTILVVDDSASVRQQVRLALSQAGFDVLEAGDGQAGLDQITANDGIAAVVCDVNMPRMNGIEMVEKVAGSPRKGVPIVMLTTEGQPAMIQRAKAAGAKGWIVKPFKPDLLVAALNKLVA
ncbi:MAG: response regulator [Myxococcales bacterium]|nr:response regulator [Myxococcales bacterium]